MSKKLNLDEAADWSEEEAWFNVKYLEDRGRYAEAAQAREAAGLPATGYPVDTNAFTPDPHQQATSVTGTNDTPEALTEDPNKKAVGPHGPNADQFEPKTGKKTKKSEDSDEDEELEEGSAEWVNASTVDEVVQWVEEAGTEDEMKQRAKDALAADADTDNGGKDRSTLRDELDELAKD